MFIAIYAKNTNNIIILNTMSTSLIINIFTWYLHPSYPSQHVLQELSQR